MTTKKYNRFIAITLIFLITQFSLFAQDDNSIIASQLSPQTIQVEAYTKWELGIQLPKVIENEIIHFLKGKGNGLNPYDPSQVDVRVILTSPEGKELIRYAFYYQDFKMDLLLNTQDPNKNKNEFVPLNNGFNWMFRFAPDQVGEWSYRFELLVMGKQHLSQAGLTFNCVKGKHKGRLLVDKKDRFLHYSNCDSSFFAIGENLSSGGHCSYLPSEHQRHINALQELIDAGGNFTRFELGAQSALPDWPILDNYQTKQDEMFAFDQMVDRCEQNDVYFILFRHHVEAWEGAEWMNIRWDMNPYHKEFKSSIIDYFSDERLIKHQQNTLRYIYSRWGYSPNMAFYGHSEVDHWYSKLQKELEGGSIPMHYPQDFKAKKRPEYLAASIMKKWLENNQIYIRDELNQEALFCHTYASVGSMEKNLSTSFFSLSDVVGLHIYGEHKDINFGKRASNLDEYRKKYQKPVFIEEMGSSYVALYCCTGIEFHNNLWSTAMMGGFGVGLDWWWDRGIHDFGYHYDMEKVNLFFENEELFGKVYEPQRWSDKGKSANKRKIENFCLISSDQERVLGWVHNATFYWRNLSDNPCIANLVAGKAEENPPCHVAHDAFGYNPSDRPYECIPRTYHNLYNPEVENLNDFDKEVFTDYYTLRGGALPVGVKEEVLFNPKFVISGLKRSGLFVKRKVWYRVDFYSTNVNDTSAEPAKSYTQELVSTLFGKLKVNVPPLNEKHPDFSYKVTIMSGK